VGDARPSLGPASLFCACVSLTLGISHQLDIIVGSIRLEDQFEWDLHNTDGSAPERFAEVYCMELGLNGDFKCVFPFVVCASPLTTIYHPYSRTAIAHCIREQVHMYQKSLFLVGHPSEGLAFQDEDLRTSFLPSLNATAARSLDQVPSFTPVLNYLSDGELERNEKEREKDLARRRRKGNRGRRGVTLPDREVLKTYRTPAIGFPDTDASALNNTTITAPTHKRAAATAATLTITNMIASENGGPVLPPSTPLNIPTPTIAPIQQKDRKPKALFKAPPVPPSVLRPRASVRAPTPSTGIAGLNVPASAIEGMSTSAPDSRASARVLTTKRARELEREAREKEFVDGQHPNFIDGVWHCSNCGCPENIAIGRRKGPLGDKSQCGTCGKFFRPEHLVLCYSQFHSGKYWHRHRRPRPVEYSTDPEFHLRQQAKGGNDEGSSKAASSKKKKPQAVVDESKHEEIDAVEDVREEEEDIAPTTVANVAKLEAQTPSVLPHPLDDRPLSPVSTASTASEPLLAERVKMNGGSSGHNSNPSTPAKTTREISERSENGVETPSEILSASRSAGATVCSSSPTDVYIGPWTDDRVRLVQPSTAPEWLKRATDHLRAKYPGDEFDVVLRKIKPDKPADWRIRCHDCPMMVCPSLFEYSGHPAEDAALGLYHRSWLHTLEL
jgi:SWI/SNF-related matrix-associated actin-dependent regulator of chromatin subfamily B protein 1